MAHLLDATAFERLLALARPLLEAAREIAATETHPQPGLDEPSLALLFEAESFGLAMQAIAHETALDEPALFVAMGGAVGTILSQCFGNHALLHKRFRDQESATYDEVTAAAKPRGRMQ